MRLLRAIYFWTAAFSATGVLYIACLAIQFGILFLGFPRDGRSTHRISTFWGRLMIKLMPGWRIETAGLDNLPKTEQPMVIVANHESMSDIWAIYYLGLQFRWLAKDSAFRVIFVGHAMKWSGYVPIVRGSRESHAAAMRTSAERIRQGLSMFFFPEGTRSADGNVKEFKLGAFKLAQEEQVPVLPIALRGASGMWPKHSWMPGRATVKVQVLPSVPPPAPGADLASYVAKVRERIIEAHKGLV